MTNELIQTIIVGIIIVCALIWIIVKALRKGGASACTGCALADTCNSKGKKKGKVNHRKPKTQSSEPTCHTKHD